MTLECVRPTQSSYMQIIHRNVGLNFFCLFAKIFLSLSLHAYISLIFHKVV